jgi:uncharacterized protein YndB with AHSA1/START domain
MRTIKIFQSLPARPSRVFRALSDARELAAWQADKVSGSVRQGSSITLAWPMLGIELVLDVVRLEDDRSIAFTHGPARLELEVARGGVELRHTAPFDDDTLEGTASAWRIALATLANYLSRHAGRTRRVYWAVARARGSVELCHAYFTEPELLAAWFGSSSSLIGAVDSSVTLSLASGRRASGPVLAHTPGRDLAIRWRETDDSMLVLRTLPVDSDRAARFLLLGWSRWSEVPEVENIQNELSRAVNQLAKRLDLAGSA